MSAADVAAGPPRAIRRRPLRILGLVVGAAAIAAIALVVMAVRTAGEAERNLHALTAVAEAIVAHAEMHDGRLPTSWADLGAIGLRGRSMYAGEPVASVQERVTVAWDFAATLDELRGKPGREGYLRPNGASFVFHDRVESIIAERR